MSKKTEQTKTKVEAALKSHFDYFGINEKTGILSKDTAWRFAGYPHIGDNYADQDVRVVIVGSDLGSDELYGKNTYHNFDTKKGQLPKKLDCCAHMAGTFATVIYLLRDKLPKFFSVVYDQNSIASGITALRAMKKLYNVPSEELISSFAMTNLHKFVIRKEVKKAGNNCRRWLDMEAEYELFKDELLNLEPTVVVFQELKSGNNLDHDHMEDLKKSLGNCTIVRLLHPSTRKKGGYRLDEEIVRKLEEASL